MGKETLTEISKRYEKSPSRPRGTDKGVRHHYIGVYEKLLAEYRENANVVVEIGVLAGFSLLMLDDYFRTATIHGIDRNGRIEDEVKKRDSIIFHHMDIVGRPDSSNQDAVMNLVRFDALFPDGSVDIVIDDASHRPLDQLAACSIMLPKLRKNGLMIIEDVYDMRLKALYRAFSASLTIYDGRCSGAYDSVLFVLEPSSIGSVKEITEF